MCGVGLAGWFALNVPSGLTLYWFTNNVLTTAQQVWLKRPQQPAYSGEVISVPASDAGIDREAEDEVLSRRVTGEALQCP
jgi:YidC/Oxa1 family membrane protein insertase